jgi:glutamyl-Q tRNA(Asp) synthetase
MEDVDQPRTVAGATERILQQLQNCGLASDEPVVLQSTRSALYEQALQQMIAQHLAYPCTCSRKDILLALLHAGMARARHRELVYPGTCRHAAPQAQATSGRPHAWRFLTAKDASPAVCWTDDRLGAQQQHVEQEVGDFVLKRADGCYTYQLAVVVDDAAQGITHVVRGIDLADNTARQILLQRALGVPTPRYLHTPLVLGTNGEKLSKQNGALALDTSTVQAALAALNQAAQVLSLPNTEQASLAAALTSWVPQWHERYRATAARMERAT